MGDNTHMSVVAMYSFEKYWYSLKYILLLIIFGLSTSIGMAIAKAYGNRVDELKEFKNI